tara:strand:- start:2376 stop:4235 length:1860 start_codon:yes stop_codon:yes gene_type:complete
MKTRCISLFAIALIAITSLQANAAHRPENLLPNDTLFVVSVPDMDEAISKFKEASGYRFFNEPFMQPIIQKAKQDLMPEFTKTFGEEDAKEFFDFIKTVKGQFTFAIYGSPMKIMEDDKPQFVVIWDAKDKAAEARKSIEKSIKKIETTRIVNEKVPGGEIMQLIPKDADKAFFGFSDSIVVLSPGKKGVQDVIRRAKGDLGNSLQENPIFRADNSRIMRNSQFIAWLNLDVIVDAAVKIMTADRKDGAPDTTNPFAAAMDPAQFFSALGLRALKSIALGMKYDSNGSEVDLFLKAPKSMRKGIISLLDTEQKSSAPPRFVSADVAKFSRWRKNARELIESIENTVREASPMMAGLFSMMIDNAGKANNPGFDFRREFIGNLGDDIIQIVHAPRAFTLDALSSPPSLYLLGSGNAQALLDAAKAAQSGMGVPGGPGVKEEEIQGNRVLVMPAGVKPNLGGGKPEPKFMYLTAARGYLAIATERDLLEDFIRGGRKGGALAESPEFRSLAERAGGLDTGWLFYENPGQTIEPILSALKKDPDSWQSLFGGNPFKVMSIDVGDDGGAKKKSAAERQKMVTDYIKLLPSYEQIRKYMVNTIGTVSLDAEGVLLKVVSPDAKN